MMEAVRTSETSVDNHFTRQYIPEDNSEHHTRCRENLKSHEVPFCSNNFKIMLYPEKYISQTKYFFLKILKLSSVSGIVATSAV
jgi:hypothetical protein